MGGAGMYNLLRRLQVFDRDAQHEIIVRILAREADRMAKGAPLCRNRFESAKWWAKNVRRQRFAEQMTLLVDDIVALVDQYTWVENPVEEAAIARETLERMPPADRQTLVEYVVAGSSVRSMTRTRHGRSYRQARRAVSTMQASL